MANPAPDIPQHIAIIMDGNGRWAKQRHLPRHAGHRAGLKTARRIIEACGNRRIPALTLFAFSSENWQRPANEVKRLMELFVNALNDETPQLHDNKVRLRFIGERGNFSPALQQQMQEAENLTAGNHGLQLQIAAGYGSRADIVAAARDCARQVVDGVLAPDAINETLFAERLALNGLAEPDLFIRTGGERRISNFLLWDMAYTELYFCDALWPDFDDDALNEAVSWFGARQRRFGRTPAQAALAQEGNHA
ncbi:MAG TPA: polyprenyl diphosphate synthase [Gammaproteobacteria bacterium]|nr:polyprenyl diphosphate synthase [Gammaproteobacteria bacterium]